MDAGNFSKVNLAALRMGFLRGKKAWGHEVALKKWPLVKSMGVSNVRCVMKDDRRQITIWTAASFARVSLVQREGREAEVFMGQN